MATNSLLDSLRAANLLPSPVIPKTFTPVVDVSVHFNAISPSDGSFVRVSQVKDTPRITISTSSPSSPPQSFTLMLIDPDAPTPDDPKFAYWRHWVVSNITAANVGAETDVVASGTTLTQYLAPGPKDESGPHRYLFLVFCEPEGFKIVKEDVGGEEFVERRSFGAVEFVDKWGLELAGVQWMRGVGDGWVGEGKVE